MKAILMTAKGGSSVLQLADIEQPEILHATEVKIKLKAAGVNPIDTKVRKNGGFYEQAPPYVLGCDGAGEIVEMGKDVSGFKVGDEVWFCHGGLGKEQGNYAEYNVIDSRWITLKPACLSFQQAAAMPLVLITAWNALFEKGNLQAGETVLIHGGAGGVGHIAIQLAKLTGAKVFTTISSETKHDFVKQLGADHIINYRQTNFADEINHLTEQNGVDLVIDTVGASMFKQSVAATSYFGRLITLLDPGEQALAEARMKNLLIGFELMLTPMVKGLDEAREKHLEILDICAEWIEQGQLTVCLDEVLPLKHVASAHDKIEQGGQTGKIVLEIS